MNDTLSFYKGRLSGGDTQRWQEHSSPTCCNQISLNFLHTEVAGILKHFSYVSSHHLRSKSHLVKHSPTFK